MTIQKVLARSRRHAGVAALVTLGILAFCGFFAPLQADAEPGVNKKMVLAGSGSNIPITKVLAEAFHKANPNIDIEVASSIGSTGGIRAAADGAVALGLISRPLKEKEKELGLTVVPYAKIAVAISVHQSVPETEISFTDLVSIYRGEKSRWKNGREIVVLTREPGDSTIEVLSAAVPGFKEAYDESQQAKRWKTLMKDAEMNKTLMVTPNGIGLSDMGAIIVEKLPLKPLRVNGVPPTAANVKSGKYPLVKTLAYAFKKEKLSPVAKRFMEFVRSEEGEKILKASGYVAVK